MTRVLTALILLPLFIATVMIPSPWYFTVLVAAAALLAVREYFHIAEATGLGVFKTLGTFLTMAFVAVSIWPDDLRQEWVIALGLFSLMASALVRKMDLSKALGAVAATFLGTFYIGFLFGYLVALKSTGTEAGKDLIFLLALTVWAGDTAAYYVGKNFGRTPLAPRISPKKTWEGAAACLGGGILAAFVASQTFIHAIQGMHGLHVVALGLALSVAGIFGDLIESALKRGAGMKDSSSLLPGHGGILDRIDSILFNAPVVYYYHQLFLR